MCYHDNMKKKSKFFKENTAATTYRISCFFLKQPFTNIILLCHIIMYKS